MRRGPAEAHGGPTTGQKGGWRGREAAEGKAGRYSRETGQVKRLRIIRTRFLTTRKWSYKNGKEENKNEPCYIVVLDWNWKCPIYILHIEGINILGSGRETHGNRYE